MLSKTPWTPTAPAKSRQYKLTKERRNFLISTVANMLRTGVPTPFSGEGDARHAVRGKLCLQHWPWSSADVAAADVVDAALRRVGARRPTWYQGQRGYTGTEGYTICANEECQKRIERPSIHPLYVMYCSEQCRKRAKNKRRYWEDPESRVAYARAKRVEARAQGETRTCEWCARQFQALDYAGKKPQRFCGLTCRSRYASSWAKRWREANEGSVQSWRADTPRRTGP